MTDHIQKESEWFAEAVRGCFKSVSSDLLTITTSQRQEAKLLPPPHEILTAPIQLQTRSGSSRHHTDDDPPRRTRGSCPDHIKKCYLQDN